jgi:two-component system NarL family sensor kinase
VALWLSRLPPQARTRRLWVPLALDILALGTVTVLAGASAVESWTAYVVVAAFAVLPVLAATQLRPGIALVLAVPTVGVYLLSSITTREANGEPWSSLVLRTAVLVILCLGSVALSRLQRSRVGEIGGLASDRSRLLMELTTIQDRERRRLAEGLHDGVLQYVLAARMDLEDVRDGDPVALDRVERALGESARLLRSTVGELHPAVLDRAGLVRAVEDLAAGARRPGLVVEVRTDGVPAGPATDADRVVFGAVRELLANVVKHAGASQVVVELTQAGGMLTAAVTDDGSGFDAETAADRADDGHIGLTSHRLRAEASGGGLVQVADRPRGTRMVVTVPR